MPVVDGVRRVAHRPHALAGAHGTTVPRLVAIGTQVVVLLYLPGRSDDAGGVEVTLREVRRDYLFPRRSAQRVPGDENWSDHGGRGEGRGRVVFSRANVFRPIPPNVIVWHVPCLK